MAHTFAVVLPEVHFDTYDYRHDAALGGAFVEGASAIGSFQLCNLTGEPMAWDMGWDRQAYHERAKLAQTVDGFHL